MKQIYLNLNIWGKLSKNGPSKICRRQPIKSFTWSILEYFVPFNSYVNKFILFFRRIFSSLPPVCNFRCLPHFDFRIFEAFNFRSFLFNSHKNFFATFLTFFPCDIFIAVKFQQIALPCKKNC